MCTKGTYYHLHNVKMQNCACYEYSGEMEGFLLPEIDGIKKITEHKLSTVCGQVLKHVKKSYRTL